MPAIVGLLLALAAPTLRADFGLTPFLPLRPTKTPALDYVAGGAPIVTKAVQACGGRNARTEIHTDGAASVVFEPTQTTTHTIACVRSKLPQVTIEARP